MSAGGLSYSGLTSYGKMVLPSIDNWNYNTNILRDPPSEIKTRRIDKVGQTSEITQMIEEAGDRIMGLNDTILVYARGIDPMTAVNFGNNGNLGGQRKGGVSSAGLVNGSSNSGKQSYLPYRIMNAGSFRPPIQDQRDLLPLSRLPRVWTSQYSQPGFADFSKKAQCFTDQTEIRGVKKGEEMLRACVKPTATYQLETPVVENYEVKYVIKNPLQTSVSSGYTTQARFNGEHGNSTQQVKENMLKAPRNVNMSGPYKNSEVENQEGYTDRYTHDRLQGNYDTNRNRNIKVTPIDEISYSDSNSNIKEINNISYTVPKRGYDKYEYVHDEIVLDRVLPEYSSRTNNVQNIYKTIDDVEVTEREYVPNRPTTSVPNREMNIMYEDPMSLNRDYRLKPTINSGGMEGIPTLHRQREDNLLEFDENRMEAKRKVYDMIQDRNLQLGQTQAVF